MNQHYDKVGKVICQECGRSYDVILPTHLKKTHDMSMNEYKEKYKGFPLASKSFGSKQKYKNTVKSMKEETLKRQLENSNKEIEIEEFNIDKIPSIDSSKSSSFINEINEFINRIPKEIPTYDDKNIHKEKLAILKFLANYFNDLKNSYFIEKINLSGILEYRLICDMCSPSNKINFEFPDTFWHNQDIPKTSRDELLIQDGWKIINFTGIKPKYTDIIDILKKNNLI